MTYWGQVRNKYRNSIKIPRKNSVEMVSILIKNFDCIELPIDMISGFFLDSLKLNVVSSVYNQDNFNKKNLVFRYFIIKETQNTSLYYEEMYPDKSAIYVFIEMRTGYIYSNCSKLFLYLIFEQGINEDDLEACNNYCMSYLSHLKRYIGDDE